MKAEAIHGTISALRDSATQLDAKIIDAPEQKILANHYYLTSSNHE